MYKQNKTIYMTYKNNIPDMVFNHWIHYNKDYNIEFSLDIDCINFLKKLFNKNLSNLFLKIDKGMYKADLWRLCKLYINGGVYSDIDIVPFFNIDILDKNTTFYSCLSIVPNSIFQAFIVCNKKKSLLILAFILSFIVNKAYTKNPNGPTYDMYNVIKYNIPNTTTLQDNIKYNLNIIKLPINIGPSKYQIKIIDLIYFPDDIKYYIRLENNNYPDKFEFNIDNSKLFIKRIDKNSGWGHEHTIIINFISNESLYLFKEINDTNIKIPNSSNEYIKYKNKIIMGSHNNNYTRDNGFTNNKPSLVNNKRSLIKTFGSIINNKIYH